MEKKTSILSRSSKEDFYYSERAVRFTEQVIVGILVCSLVVVPIATLSSISNKSLKLFAIILSVILAWLVSLLLVQPSDRVNMNMMLT